MADPPHGMQPRVNLSWNRKIPPQLHTRDPDGRILCVGNDCRGCHRVGRESRLLELTGADDHDVELVWDVVCHRVGVKFVLVHSTEGNVGAESCQIMLCPFFD